MNRNAAKLRFICGNVARRAALRIRYRKMLSSIRRLRASRAASKSRRRAPILNGVHRYYRKNKYGNIVLPPIIVNGPKPLYIAPKMRKPGFRKVFDKARPSAIFSGSSNFSDLEILKIAVMTVTSIARNIRNRRSILDTLHNKSLVGNVFEYVCSEYEKLQLDYVKALYIFLNTKTGKYIRRFQRRGFEWDDMNNADDSWMKGWEFEFIDELWMKVWDRIPEGNGGTWYNNHGKIVPGKIPLRRIWRRKDYVTDESVKQIIKYLIEELIEPPYWNAAYAYVL